MMSHDLELLVPRLAEGIVEPLLTAGLVAGDPNHVAAFDRAIRDHAFAENIVALQVRLQTGTVAYSTEPLLIGTTTPLDAAQADALMTGRAYVNSDSLSENGAQTPTQFASTIGVFTPVEGPGGEPLLLEFHYSDDLASGHIAQVRRTIVPPYFWSRSPCSLRHNFPLHGWPVDAFVTPTNARTPSSVMPSKQPPWKIGASLVNSTTA